MASLIGSPFFKPRYAAGAVASDFSLGLQSKNRRPLYKALRQATLSGTAISEPGTAGTAGAVVPATNAPPPLPSSTGKPTPTPPGQVITGPGQIPPGLILPTDISKIRVSPNVNYLPNLSSLVNTYGYPQRVFYITPPGKHVKTEVLFQFPVGQKPLTPGIQTGKQFLNTPLTGLYEVSVPYPDQYLARPEAQNPKFAGRFYQAAYQSAAANPSARTLYFNFNTQKISATTRHFFKQHHFYPFQNKQSGATFSFAFG